MAAKDPNVNRPLLTNTSVFREGFEKSPHSTPLSENVFAIEGEKSEMSKKSFKKTFNLQHSGRGGSF